MMTKAIDQCFINFFLSLRYPYLETTSVENLIHDPMIGTQFDSLSSLMGFAFASTRIAQIQFVPADAAITSNYDETNNYFHSIHPFSFAKSRYSRQSSSIMPCFPWRT